MEDEFWKQATGSGAANIATGIVFFLFWVIRNKCKHSKCVGHSLCCDIEINDDESKSEEDHEDDAEGDIENQVAELKKLRKQIEIQMQKLHSRLDKGVHGSD